jgi:hypothetical protein
MYADKLLPMLRGLGSCFTEAGKASVLHVVVLSILVSFEQRNGLRFTWL